jgi:hypothetical protein
MLRNEDSHQSSWPSLKDIIGLVNISTFTMIVILLPLIKISYHNIVRKAIIWITEIHSLF